MRRPRLGLMLETLAQMRVEWTDETDAMMAVAIGMVLRRLDHDRVTINLKDVEGFLRNNEIDRTLYDDPDTGARTLTVTITRKMPEVTSGS